ncbi:unnamed protein product [Hermetia illucens]|uniref:SCP domain-containing protein n=1 Tax=Hermetia illucens TaxID=343691 RepID=A0A7R8V392_HERIL|nr:antigen 5 like allergen Cul n 1-like [Hermetia illucens]CAD7091197.1 unnamed protein product [Hermetia illucens]
MRGILVCVFLAFCIQARVSSVCYIYRGFGPKCPADAQILDSFYLKDVFVEAHNFYRNLVASGYLPGYEPAARMATMVWDDELALLAENNVRSCDYEHDSCTTTSYFTRSGQNLIAQYKGQYYDPIQFIQSSMQTFFDEHKKADMSYVYQFRADNRFEEIGHFTEMILDRNVRVGCAIVQFTEKGWTRLNMACNYASIHKQGRPLYEPGPPASRCLTGPNPQYPGLCSTYENFDPNWRKK